MRKFFPIFFIVILLSISLSFLGSCNHIILIKPIKATGFSSYGHSADKAVDGALNTYYETPSTSADIPNQDSFRRNIDFEFDGVYEFSSININQYVDDKYADTYNHYEIYISAQTDDWQKVAFKENNNIASTTGEKYDLRRAFGHVVRVNLSFNSWWNPSLPNGISGMTCPLAEIKFFGYKISRYIPDSPSTIPNFQDTTYYTRRERFLSDPEYRKKRIIQSLKDLVGHVLGNEYINSFNFDINSYSTSDQNDNFTLSSNNNRINIVGNNGNALASGFNFYIKEKLFVDYNPLFSSHLINKTIFTPNNLPTLTSPINKTANYQYRYALNYCTYSYTMAFWTWKDWQQFLDWSAMNGINLMLDITGQEEIIRETLKDFNYTDDEAKQYISGPAYFAWFYMGNMTGYGGTLPDTWFASRVDLARKIHELMQYYDIVPVMQGFAGNVPDDLNQHNPEAIVHEAATWCNFNRTQGFLDPMTSSTNEDFFTNYLISYENHLTNLFGNISIFRSADPFHERWYPNYPTDANQRAEIYVSIMNKLKSVVGNNVIWLMQQWGNDVHEQDLQALLGSSSFNANVLVLDLQAEISPNHDAMENTKTPWIWSMINNFGGRMGIYGVPQNILNIPSQSSTHTSNPGNNYITGIGIAPESFGNSPFLYELLLDMNWENPKPTLANYVNHYLSRSYGSQYSLDNLNADDGAWSTLLATAYDPDLDERGDYQGAPESVFNARPWHAINKVSCWGGTDTGYDMDEFKNVLEPFIDSYIGNNDANNSPNFIYDMADVARQCLQNWALDNIPQIGDSNYTQRTDTFLNAIDLQDKILSKIDNWRLGKWIGKSRNMWNGMDDWNKDLFEFNARSLVTTWAHVNTANGTTDSYLHEYSNRQWSGLTKSIYTQRWQRYFEWNKVHPGEEFETADWFKYEWEWVNQKSDEGFGFDQATTQENLKSLAEQVKNIIFAS